MVVSSRERLHEAGFTNVQKYEDGLRADCHQEMNQEVPIHRFRLEREDDVLRLYYEHFVHDVV